MTVELHQFPPAWGLQPSPFCQKVDNYLRLAGLPFRTVSSLGFRAPKGKLPFIVDGGRRIPDSGRILAYLQATYGDPLDGALSVEQKALGHVLRRTCEESLYFALVYSRWIDDAGWRVVRPAFFGQMPLGVRSLVPALARRGIARSLRGQGYGRHARDEVYALGIADLDALATLLGDRPYAVCDHPTSFDAVIHAFLMAIVRPPVETPLKAHALANRRLMDYLDRMDDVLAAAA